MLNNLLKELGFSDYEIKIYSALLKLGESTAGNISAIAQVNRRNVYDALNRLIRKGYVSSHIVNKKTVYSAADPNKIGQDFQQKVDLVNKLIPEILTSKKAREVQVFEGKEGMKTIFTQLFDLRKPVFVIGATGNSIERLPFFMSQLFMRKLAQIPVQQLWNPGSKNLKSYNHALKSEDRILPFKTSTQIFLCGDISIILIWSEHPLAISIKDTEVNHGFKQYFDFLWKCSKKI